MEDHRIVDLYWERSESAISETSKKYEKMLNGISYSLLGLLVLINFCTQLTVDLAFSFFSHKFNIPRAVKMTPVLTVIGLAVYAIWPFFFADSSWQYYQDSW